MKLLRSLVKRASVKVALSVAAVTTLGCLISPLLAVHGVESALVLGLVLPPFVAAMSARITIAARRRSLREVGTDVSAVTGLVLVVPFVGLLLGAFRARWCAPLEGLAFFVLGPVVGVVLAAVVGALAGLAIERPRLATTVAALTPIAVALLGLVRFYSTPAIFAYSHFVGYFPGSLYDPDVAIEGRYLTFRLLTLAWIGCGAFLLWAGFDTGALRTRALRARPLATGLAVALALFGGLGELYGASLGHRSTAESMTEALGSSLRGERCTVVVPHELPRDVAERLRDDCDFRIWQAEHVIGITHPARITAFFFRSEEEKREQMGASGTYIAKPWRDEVYLQLATDPHPVLFHELVHAVLSATGVGPFRISGSLGGLLPSPSIIEGLAVAIAWDAREGLTPHQWARAMVEVGHAPSIASTEGLGFLLQPASRAYTANGSFVRWILDTRGSGAVRTLYRTGDYEAALGMPLEDAEREWRAFLDTVEVPPGAIALAEYRFAQPAIFTQVCPHAIAAIEGELESAEASGDDAAAIAACDAIARIDEGTPRFAARRIGALARSGELDEAEHALRELEAHEDTIPGAVIVTARDALADALFTRGELARARALYERSAEVPATDDQARQLEVKLLAIDAGGASAAALAEVLVPDARAPHDAATTIEALARLEETREDGLADYMMARQMTFRQRYDLAGPRLRRALERGLPTERIVREARRLEAISRVRTGDLDGAERALWEIERTGDEGARVEAHDWLMRITWMRERLGPG
jgi:tetratricopeptide (TPR) repeat protein